MRVEPCLMMEKIEWYQEVLKLDPDSKVFFPLAKLLRDSQQPDKAIEVLRAGLQHSSVFLEARLLLIQILFEQSRAGECSEELSTVTGLLERYPAFWEVWAESVSEKNRDLALAIRLMASTIRHPEHSLSLILESGLGILQDVRRSFSSSQSIEASDSEPPCGVSHEETLCTATPSAQELSSCTVPVEESSIADAELLESMLEDSAPVREHPSCVTPFLPNKAKSVHWVDPDEDSDLMADENPEEPTLRTRSMADVLAEQGDIVGALEIYQELEAAAPTPEEARELHDSVAALVSRMAGNSTEPGEQTEIGEPSYGDVGGQNQLMSLLESLADRLEARARV